MAGANVNTRQPAKAPSSKRAKNSENRRISSAYNNQQKRTKTTEHRANGKHPTCSTTRSSKRATNVQNQQQSQPFNNQPIQTIRKRCCECKQEDATTFRGRFAPRQFLRLSSIFLAAYPSRIAGEELPKTLPCRKCLGTVVA